MYGMYVIVKSHKAQGQIISTRVALPRECFFEHFKSRKLESWETLIG